MADSVPVQKKKAPATGNDRPKRWNSHSANSDWTMKPPPNASRLKSAASPRTLRREGPSGARGVSLSGG